MIQNIGNIPIELLTKEQCIPRCKMLIDMAEYAKEKGVDSTPYTRELKRVYGHAYKFGRKFYLESVDECTTYGKIKRGEELWPESS